ncbi:hypothetical protein GCM10007940_18740 [Portibacter lacus]|uniref:Uncharacterized protein n=1 Tax=Portibacter lacus TaxID=1099794 RepID=A0AA37SQ71_9BACT|nr:hypothetical protein GCM10007940_18740 [Portibacter lacus]
MVSQSSLAVLEVEVINKYNDQEQPFHQYVDFLVRNTLSSTDNTEYRNLTLIESNSSCDLFLFESLEKGDRLVINYERIIEHADANYPGIFFSSCSNNVLKLENNKVVGNITNNLSDEDQTMSYSKFKEKVNDLCDLPGLDENSVEISTNLIGSYIDLKNKHQTILSFQIFSSAGQLANYGKIAPDENLQVLFEGYPADVYFIRFRNPYSQITRKIIKVQ